MQFFTGSPALSSFRLDKLLTEIQQQVPAVSCLASHYIHFADIDGELTTEETAILQKLLEYGPQMHDSSCEGELFLVTPRAGTISPWSSKSTDIAHNCGLHRVLRLERGIAYHLGVSEGRQLPAEEIACIQHILHDRMTEMVLRSYEAATVLF
jgi:phosphoribosylformylglycinamidine synthase